VRALASLEGLGRQVPTFAEESKREAIFAICALTSQSCPKVQEIEFTYILDAVKNKAKLKKVPYTRYIRMLIERDISTS
jgi:hypothetical protein